MDRIKLNTIVVPMNETGMMRDTSRMKIAYMVAVGCLAFCMFSVVRRTDAAQNDQPSLDELLQLMPSPRSTPNRENIPTDQSTPQDIQADVLQQLSERQPGDVFGQAVQEMDQVADRMGRDLDAGLETQRLQESILSKLDQVIAAAKEAGLSASSGSGGAGSSRGQAQQQDTGSALNAAQQGGQSQGGSQDTGASGSGSSGAQSAAAQHDQGALNDHSTLR